MPTRSRRAIAGLASWLTIVLVSGCSESEYVGSGSWQAKPSPQVPDIPKPEQPMPPGSGGSGSDQPADDGVRATGLDQPAAIAALPDGTAVVGERTSGRVTKVFPSKGVPQQELFTVAGVDASNGGGLVAMVASPFYQENGLIYAYLTTATDGRVVSLNAMGVVKPLVTGLPRATAAMAIAPDGSVLVATGGGGGPQSGKVLSIDPWGGPGPAAGADLVVAGGVANPLGLCSDGINVFAVDGGTGPAGSLTGNAVYKVSGEEVDTGGLGSAMAPLISYTAGKDAGASGCVATGVAIVTAGTDSQSLATSILGQDGVPAAEPTLSLTGEFGRLRAIALDPAGGGLWVATYNRDGIGTPAENDDRVLLIPPPAGGGSSGDVS